MDYRVKQGVYVWTVKGAVDIMDALRIIERSNQPGRVRPNVAVIITPINNEGEE